MKVLVAEDSPLLRAQIVQQFLEFPGVEIVGLMSGALQACQAIGELKPDVVILDLVFAGGNGIDVIRSITCAEVHPVIIVLTDRTSPPYREKAMKAGADFFLDKWMEFGKLREIISSINQ